MRRLIAVIFLFSFLFSGTEMHELFKIPHLLAHYIEHSSESKEISLLDFIKEHYNGAENLHHTLVFLFFLSLYKQLSYA